MAFQSVYKTDAVVCTYLHGNNSSCVLFFICDNLTFDKILQHNYRYNVTAVNHDNMGDICCICSQFSLGDHSIQYNIVCLFLFDSSFFTKKIDFFFRDDYVILDIFFQHSFSNMKDQINQNPFKQVLTKKEGKSLGLYTSFWSHFSKLGQIFFEGHKI